MNHFEQEEEFLSRLERGLAELSGYSAQNLMRSDLENLGFDDYQDFFQMVIDAAADAQLLTLSPGNGNVLQHAAESVEAMNAHFNQIMNLAQAPAFASGGKLIDQAVTRWKTELSARLASLQMYGLKNSALMKAARKYEKATQEGLVLTDQIESKRIEIDTWFAASTVRFQEEIQKVENEIVVIKDLVAKLGVATYAARFEEESNEYKEESRTWYDRIIGCAWAFLIASVIVLYAEYAAPHATDGLVSWFASTTSRLVILSLPTIGLLLCMRNYAACRHNYIVNKHRQNALSTFHLFREAAVDDETKKAVLLQALQAVFSPQSSGYLKSASDTQPSSQFIELINKTVKDD